MKDFLILALFLPHVSECFPAFGGIKWFVNFLTGNLRAYGGCLDFKKR